MTPSGKGNLNDYFSYSFEEVPAYVVLYLLLDISYSCSGWHDRHDDHHLHDHHHDDEHHQVEDDLFLDRVVAVGRGSRRLPNPGWLFTVLQAKRVKKVFIIKIIIGTILIIIVINTSKKGPKRCLGWFPRKRRSHLRFLLPSLCLSLDDPPDDDDDDEN